MCAHKRIITFAFRPPFYEEQRKLARRNRLLSAAQDRADHARVTAAMKHRYNYERFFLRCVHNYKIAHHLKAKRVG
jgi:hypothetical protein